MRESGYRLTRALGAPVDAPCLDAEQQAVLTHPGGPLLVLAGPGTGKTTTLVETAVERVGRGVPVDNLLMLTFSRRAAGELRDRVATRLAGTVGEPVARTLHSYAFGVLRMAAVANRTPAPRLLAAAEQDIVIRDLLADADPSAWPVQLRPALRTLGFADQLRDLLMRAVERGVDGAGLARMGAARGRPDWIAAGRFLDEYVGVTVLRDAGAYDPAELIRAALNVLQDDPALLAAERSRRRHLFVDEYQDCDPAQLDLLGLLADGAEETVLVADPDQTIYAFRGADESAVREVDVRFGVRGQPVPVLALRTSRRCGPTMLAASRRVAARLPGPAAHRALRCADANEAAGPFEAAAADRVSVAVFTSASEEAAYLAGSLRAAHLRGVAWSQMAVLVRSTVLSLGTLRRAMITAGVPVTVRRDDIPLSEQPAATMLLVVLGYAHDPDSLNEDVAEQLLLGPLGAADALTLRRLRRALRQQFGDAGAALAPAVVDVAGARVLPERVRHPVERVARVLTAARGAFLDGAATESVLWQAWQASALSRRWAQASAGGGAAGAAADRDLDAAVALFADAARFADRLPGAGPDQFLEHVRAQQVPGDASDSRGAAEPDAVSIMTAHAAKGLEWEVVCVAQVQEGSWPDLRRRGSLLGTEILLDALRGVDTGGYGVAEQLAQERRLFYVAVTRARRQLLVTAVAGVDDQPSRFLDELDPTDVRRPVAGPIRGVHLPALVSELRAAVCQADAAPGRRTAAARQLARLAQAQVGGADPEQWWGLAPLSTTAGAADPVRPVPVSPSRVEGFGECELRSLLNGFGASDSDQVAASLGTLVHEVASAVPDDADVAELERRLDELWGRLDFGAAWYAANEGARATTMVTRLVTWLRASRGHLQRVEVELAFEVALDDAVVSGRVDRLERDRAGRLVIVDLKTGRTAPSAATASTNAQLSTYQLAVALGGFREQQSAEGVQPGGAVLVALGASTIDVTRTQPPLAELPDPDKPLRDVLRVVSRMRGHEFSATANERCGHCDLRICCPLQDVGRQVGP